MSEYGATGESEDYQEVTSESWCERLSSACTGILIGFVLFIGAFPLLYWNEGRAVDRYEVLHESESLTASISALSIDSANEGKIVHFVADVKNGGPAEVSDPIFGVSSPGALKLRRSAEIYEWKETVKTSTKTKTGGSKEKIKSYSYDKYWSTSLINSDNFKRQSGHQNPKNKRFESLVLASDNITIGAFTLPSDLVDRISWYEDISVSVNDIPDSDLRTNVNVRSDSSSRYYLPYNPNSATSVDSIGDERFTFSAVPPKTVTVVGVQVGGTLAPYRASNGEGGDVLLFEQGSLTAEEMYDQAEAQNKLLAWVLRFAGFGVMTGGIYLVLRPVEVFADVLPCVGDIVGFGLTFVASVVGGLLSGLTISIAWLIHHPKIGGIILGVTLALVGGLAFLSKYVEKKRKKSARGDFEEEKLINEDASEEA